MDFWRHIGGGRLSEMFGESQLETDKFLRTLGWTRTAEQELELIRPETRAALEAYAEGVNAYLGSRSETELSLEYAVLGLTNRGYEPEPWTPVNTLTWVKVMSWDLCGNLSDEVQRTVLLNTLSREQVEDLYPPYAEDMPAIVPAWGEEEAGGVAAAVAAAGMTADLRAALPEALSRALPKLAGRVADRLDGANPVGSTNPLGGQVGVVGQQGGAGGRKLSRHHPVIRADAGGRSCGPAAQGVGAAHGVGAIQAIRYPARQLGERAGECIRKRGAEVCGHPGGGHVCGGHGGGHAAGLFLAPSGDDGGHVYCVGGIEVLHLLPRQGVQKDGALDLVGEVAAEVPRHHLDPGEGVDGSPRLRLIPTIGQAQDGVFQAQLRLGAGAEVGVDSLRVGLERCPCLRPDQLQLLLRRACPPQRAQELIRLQLRLPEHLRQASAADMAPEIHLVEAILGVYVALSEEKVVLGVRVDVGNPVLIPYYLRLRVQAGELQSAVRLRKGAAYRPQAEATGRQSQHQDGDQDPHQHTAQAGTPARGRKGTRNARTIPHHAPTLPAHHARSPPGLHCPAGVHDQRCLRPERGLHELPVCRGQHQAVIAPELLGRQRHGAQPYVMPSSGPGFGKVWVAVGDIRFPFLEQLNDLVAGGLPVIIDVWFVGESQHQHARSFEALAVLVQGFHHLVHHPGGHAVVDLSRQVDETGPLPVVGGFPGQVEGVQRDAVPAQARSGIERLVAERFGLGRLYHLKDVDAHGLKGHLELIHQGDIHRAVDVLQEFSRLRYLGGGEGHYLLHGRPVQGGRHLRGLWVHPAHQLGDGVGGEVGVARVLALGAEGQEEVVLGRVVLGRRVRARVHASPAGAESR